MVHLWNPPGIGYNELCNIVYAFIAAGGIFYVVYTLSRWTLDYVSNILSTMWVNSLVYQCIELHYELDQISDIIRKNMRTGIVYDSVRDCIAYNYTGLSFGTLVVAVILALAILMGTISCIETAYVHLTFARLCRFAYLFKNKLKNITFDSSKLINRIVIVTICAIIFSLLSHDYTHTETMCNTQKYQHRNILESIVQTIRFIVNWMSLKLALYTGL